MISLTRTPVVLAILGFAFVGRGLAAQPQAADQACAACHEQGKQVLSSAHAEVGCASCHPKHEEYPHATGVPKPECSQCHSNIAGEHARSVHGQAIKHGNAAAPTCTVCHGSAHELKPAVSEAFHKTVPDTCGMCHTEISEQFKASVHGQAVEKGVAAAPVCTSCHGEHNIQAPNVASSTVNASHIRETCGQCHGNVRLSKKFGLPADRIVSFDASYHGLAAKTGSQSVANCASCHGFHNILASSDPRSSTNVKNLPATCGHCHPGAGERFALGPVHQAEGQPSEPEPVYWVRLGYSILIPLTIGYMLLHNLGDWFRKLRERRFQPGRKAARRRAAHVVLTPELRMYGLERIQHALLAISFLVLVWTGFALKYPDQWWARPLVSWERYWPVRGTVHRIASVVFMACGVLHLATLVFSRRLREHWKEMWPRRSDVVEIIRNFAYNMGLLRQRPVRSSHSYIEKMEYWAVVWGGVIMGLSGITLWAVNWTLRFLPKTAVDIATSVHLYEAVLATLAIVVWHFYTVIFDPDVYPLETAFLTGVSVKKQETPEDGPAAAAELVNQNQSK